MAQRRARPQPGRQRSQRRRSMPAESEPPWQLIFESALTQEKWALICGRAIAQAMTGDPDARRWVTEQLEALHARQQQTLERPASD